VILFLGYSDNLFFFVWHELTDGGTQTSTIPGMHGRPKLLPFVGYSGKKPPFYVQYRLITCRNLLSVEYVKN
jgi:hypothetical protein